jgi:hypothetical protein
MRPAERAPDNVYRTSSLADLFVTSGNLSPCLARRV